MCLFRGKERVSLYIEGEGELTRKICLMAGRKEKFLWQKQAVCLRKDCMPKWQGRVNKVIETIGPTISLFKMTFLYTQLSRFIVCILREGGTWNDWKIPDLWIQVDHGLIILVLLTFIFSPLFWKEKRGSVDDFFPSCRHPG